MRAYDPAYAYELAVIILDGLRRMIDRQEDVLYYITLYNENYEMPPMPEGVEEGILEGMYLLSPGPDGGSGKSKTKQPRVQLWGSGPLVNAALEAQKLLASQFKVDSDVWSVTSYQLRYRNARAAERRNRNDPLAEPEVPYVTAALEGHEGPVVATLDWVNEIPSMLGRFVPRRFLPLGANGYGRSDTREALRDHFEIDARWTAYTALVALAQDGVLDAQVAVDAARKLGIDTSKRDPISA